MPEPYFKVNPEKQEFVTVGTERFACYAIPTPLVEAGCDLDKLVLQYITPLLRPGDIVILSEKMVACAQGRAYPLDSIQAGFAARFLSSFVQKTPTGIGLSMPETMQCAIWECGLPRILLAAAAGALGKLFRQKGWFYRVAGRKAAAVDGPCSFTIAPYNHCVVPAPSQPKKVARQLSQVLNHTPVCIIDCNDLGGCILACSHRNLDIKKLIQILKQNPLGQGCEQMPMGIVRKID